MIIESYFNKAAFLYHLVGTKATSGAEIGVFKGDFSVPILKTRPDLKLYLVDPWCKIDDYKDQTLDYYSEYALEYMYLMVKEAVRPYKNVEILRMTSLEAMPFVPDNSLDFVYIDADHKYERVEADIEGWEKKVKKGGLVLGHDFDLGHPGVLRAVREFSDDKKIDIAFNDQDKLWIIVKSWE